MASIKQRRDGVWRARYRDDAGREHAKHFALKRDAQRWLDEVTASVVTGQYVDPKAGKVTWRAYAESWMSRQVWTDGTLEAASTAVKSVPWLDEPIGVVRNATVQSWVSSEVKRGLAASTIQTRLNYVSMAFRAAVVDKKIAESPAVGVKPPRTRRKEAAMKVLTIDQVAASLEAAGEFRAFVAVCVFAGLRLGEAAGLQLGDVNFLKRTISVRRQVQGATLKAAKLVPPKAGSERDVFVPDALMALLSAHVTRQRVLAPDEMLFTDVLGRVWNRGTAGGEWRRIRAAAGFSEDVTLHTLRHTFASNLIASGCDVVTVQRALGHSTPSITLNVYSHLWPSAEDKTRTATGDFMSSVADSADYLRTGSNKTQVSAMPYR